MTYASACSGVEAASLAWEPLGFKPVFFSEIEPFPSAVLAARYKACGNSMCVNVMRWLGVRIQSESISISGECRETPRGGEGSWKTAVPPADPVAVTSEDER